MEAVKLDRAIVVNEAEAEVKPPVDELIGQGR